MEREGEALGGEFAERIRRSREQAKEEERVSVAGKIRHWQALAGLTDGDEARILRMTKKKTGRDAQIIEVINEEKNRARRPLAAAAKRSKKKNCGS
jgi:hypothetical protein